jgi:hypothetical protein
MEFVRVPLHPQPDGTYRGAALPGPGMVVVRRSPKRYVPAVADQKGFFKLDRMPNLDYGGSATDLWLAARGGAGPQPLPVRQFQAVAFANPARDAAEVNVTLELDPGATKVLRPVDPDGRPLAGVRYKEGQEDRWSDPDQGAERGVTGIGPGSTRGQTLRHDERRLAAWVEITPDTPSPFAVTLKPWATATGRLVDPDGKPLAGRVLYGLPDYIVTDGEGRFRIEKLPPEHGFDVLASRDGTVFGRFPERVSARPGETRDLGDVRVKSAPGE